MGTHGRVYPKPGRQGRGGGGAFRRKPSGANAPRHRQTLGACFAPWNRFRLPVSQGKYETRNGAGQVVSRPFMLPDEELACGPVVCGGQQERLRMILLSISSSILHARMIIGRAGNAAGRAAMRAVRERTGQMHMRLMMILFVAITSFHVMPAHEPARASERPEWVMGTPALVADLDSGRVLHAGKRPRLPLVSGFADQLMTAYVAMHETRKPGGCAWMICSRSVPAPPVSHLRRWVSSPAPGSASTTRF